MTRQKRLVSARGLAIVILGRVRASDAYLNAVLDAELDAHAMKDPRDAGLVTELCYGTVRRQLALDELIVKFTDRALHTIEDKVLAALRVGAYQLVGMRIPIHAAVGETVGALKEVGLERASGFANAILRRISEWVAALPEGTNAFAKLAESKESEVDRWSIEHSHPTWLVNRWVRQFGKDRALEMMRASNEAPPVVIRTNTAATSRDELLKELQSMGVKAEATSVSPVGILLETPGRVEDVFGYREGLWQVQDEAAQLVGLMVQVASAEAKVLDVCAAPGGKTCHLLQSYSVKATDLYANKLPKIQSEARRLNLALKLSTEVLDATKPIPDSWGEFDVVMVDAPCSGLGTLRRHPELRYRRTEADFAELAGLQRTILENAQVAVAPGGLLIYAVCSTDSSEGADQIELFLRSHPEFTAEPPNASEVKFPLLQGYLRTLPGPQGWDGFFAARLRKLY